MVFQLPIGAVVLLQINVIWEEGTVIQIRIALAVLHAVSTTAEMIFIQPEAIGLALRIAVKQEHM